MNTRDNQHGGIVIFAIIGILLVSLLAGSLYVVRHQARLAAADKPAPVAIDTEKEATETKDGETYPPKEEENKPAPTPAPTPTTPTPTPKPQTPATPAPVTPSTPTVPRSGPSETVPATGPADTLLGVGIVAAVAFASFGFIQSNARLRRSALGR